MSLAAGIRLGPYDLQSRLGNGSMGEVYAATDTRLDRTVAIKVLPAELASDPDRRERFEREAKAIAALNHPHICTLHDVRQMGDALSTHRPQERAPGPADRVRAHARRRAALVTLK